MKVIVCGSRNFNNRELMNRTLPGILGPGDHTIINGAAKGADKLSTTIANEKGWEVVEYPAEWSKHGKSAGPIRNQQMIVENPDVDVVIAYPLDLNKSKGTLHMIKTAASRGYPVVVVPDKDHIWQLEQEKELKVKQGNEHEN